MTDATYYARRARQERRAAAESTCIEARRIHQALADRYAVLSLTPDIKLAA